MRTLILFLLFLTNLCIANDAQIVRYKVMRHKIQTEREKLDQATKPDPALVRAVSDLDTMDPRQSKGLDISRSGDRQCLNTWATALRKEYAPPVLVPVPEGRTYRLLAEGRTYPSQQQSDNFQKAKELGYTGVVLVWRYGDDVRQVPVIAQELKNLNMTVWFAIGPRERISVYGNMTSLLQAVRVLAQVSEGMILTWRQSSTHQHKGVALEQYQLLLAVEARQVNSDLLLVAERFYENHDKVWIGTVPAWASMVLAVGCGYQQVAAGSVEYKLRTEFQLPVGMLVVGWTGPYYNSFGKQITAQQERMSKLATEQKCLRSGLICTVTLAGDGADGIVPASKGNDSLDGNQEWLKNKE